MSISALILGESGTGKTTSLRNMDAATTLLIQCIRKPLPFRSKGWVPLKEGGNIIVTDNAVKICDVMRKTSRDIIVIDDFQYQMSNEFMRRVTDQEAGASAFAKYNEIAKSAWDIMNCAAALPDNKRVYILSHTQTDEFQHVKIKTIGKLLDEKIVIEGMVSIVLRTEIFDGRNFMRTKNNGSDTVKTPMCMFEDERVVNDLAAIDAQICNYYNITTTKEIKPC
jgi:hypothetical protein